MILTRTLSLDLIIFLPPSFFPPVKHVKLVKKDVLTQKTGVNGVTKGWRGDVRGFLQVVVNVVTIVNSFLTACVTSVTSVTNYCENTLDTHAPAIVNQSTLFKYSASKKYCRRCRHLTRRKAISGVLC